MQRLMPEVVCDLTRRIALVDAAADTLLAAAIERIQRPGLTAGAAVSSFALRATELRTPMVVHVLPVRGAAHDVFATANAILLITPVQNAAAPDSKLLQALFDLTPAESRIAQGIGNGETVEAIAARLGISTATARSQLKGVMAKTGTGRQTELALLLSGGYWPDRDRNGIIRRHETAARCKTTIASPSPRSSRDGARWSARSTSNARATSMPTT